MKLKKNRNYENAKLKLNEKSFVAKMIRFKPDIRKPNEKRR